MLNYPNFLTICDIWVMKEYSVVESRIKQFIIDLQEGAHVILGSLNNNKLLLLNQYCNNLVCQEAQSQQRNIFFNYAPLYGNFMPNFVETLTLLIHNAVKQIQKLSSSFFHNIM